MPKVENKPYVLHFCKNKDCDQAWIGPDEYGVKSVPPRHLYCLDCQVYLGLENKKSTAKVEAGKRLAELAKRRKQLEKDIEGL